MPQSDQPLLTLLDHDIQGEQSCIAWAVEYIAKIHVPALRYQYPIQTKHPAGLSFGKDATALLAQYEIDAKEDAFEWVDFEKVSKEDANRGFPLVFSFPVRVPLNIQGADIGFGDLDAHGAIALHHPTLEYGTRFLGDGNPIIVRAKALYQFVRDRIRADYKIHCLRHWAAQKPIPGLNRVS